MNFPHEFVDAVFCAQDVGSLGFFLFLFLLSIIGLLSFACFRICFHLFFPKAFLLSLLGFTFRYDLSLLLDFLRSLLSLSLKEKVDDSALHHRVTKDAFRPRLGSTRERRVVLVLHAKLVA